VNSAVVNWPFDTDKCSWWHRQPDAARRAAPVSAAGANPAAGCGLGLRSADPRGTPVLSVGLATRPMVLSVSEEVKQPVGR